MSVRLFAWRPRAKRSNILVAAAASVLAMTATAESAVFTWGNASGGTYSISNNWVPLGPPAAADTARFNLNTAYTVNFAATANISLLDVLDGTVTLSAAGAARNYNPFNTTLHGGDVVLGGAAFPLTLLTSGILTINTGSQLTVSQGNTSSSGTVNLGTVSGAGTGTIVVDGVGSNLFASGTTSLGLNGGAGVLTLQNSSVGGLAALDMAATNSAGSIGTFSVLGGADVTASGDVRIGTGGASGQSATLSVSGSGSTFAQTGDSNFTLGAAANSTATLTVGAGAAFSTSIRFFTVNPTGTINIAGNFIDNADLNIVGGTMTRQSGSSFSMGNIAQLNVLSGGHFNNSGLITAGSNNSISVGGAGSLFGGSGTTITLANGSQLLAGSGGLVNAPSGLNIGSSGTALADFQGTDTRLTAGAIQIGNGGGTGTLTFSLGATGSATVISIGENVNNSNGTLTVKSGAHFGGQFINVATTGHTGAVGVVNVQDSGSQLWPNQSGIASINVGAQSGSSGTINVTSDGTLNMGTIHGACVSVGTGSGTFTLNPTGRLNIDGGRAQLGRIVQNGGVLNFSSGALGYSGDLTVGPGGLFSAPLTINSRGVLALDGVTTVQPGSVLTLSGGEFGTGDLVVDGAFVFTSGTLGLCGPAGFRVGSNQLFGQNFTLGSGKAIFVGNATTVEADSTLTIDGGDFTTQSLTNSGSVNVISGGFKINFATFTNNAGGRFFIERSQAALLEGPLNNAGRVELGSGNARLLGSDNFTNTGILLGGGEVGLNLTNAVSGEIRAQSGERLLISATNGTNAGVINALGGTVEFSKSLTSTGQINLVGGTAKFGGLMINNGVISGRGVITANAGLTNNGQVQLSAGLTDVFGAITGNSGSKVIVSGGGTATFYNNVTMNSGSEFRVSTASTAVFFGNVTGSNFFTGSGIKDFEGGSSTLGAVSTSGSTIAQAPASISASFFRENSLTVAGHVTIDTSGGTSHLNSLDVEPGGVLDLKNNSLVLETGDLQAITAQIRSGLNAGTGIISTAPGAPFRLGSMSNAGTIYSSFQGISGLNGDEVLIRYTRIGDLNLDGTVTISDFIDLASNFNHVGGATWQMGDVNYDGSVTISDFIDLASNFGQSVSGEALALGDSDARMLASFAATNGASAVPEPTCLTFIAAAASLLLRRNRKLPLASPDNRGVP